MRERIQLIVSLGVLTACIVLFVGVSGEAQEKKDPPPVVKDRPKDIVEDFQKPRNPAATRPEQQKNKHDQSDAFDATKAKPINPALAEQPQEGKVTGFDFFRDPLDAKKPMQSPQEIMEADIAAKANVMAMQKKLLEARYNLTPKSDPQVTMSRGKPVPVGPTAKLPEGTDWAALAGLSPEEIRKKGIFPYPSLPHPKHATGGQVFPKFQIDQFPRLERFDVDFDIPDAFLPEFPPAIFLQNRPELGDVSRGEVVSINNFRRLFKDLLTPVQLEGLRLLLTPLPQEEFNATDDRKTRDPSLGVACMDSRLEAQPALSRRLHRIRATHGLLQRRPDSRDEKGVIVADTINEVMKTLQKVEPDPARARLIEASRDYSVVEYV